MEQLTKYQVGILVRLANSSIKQFCSPRGLDSDRRRKEIDDDFEALIRLIDIGLMVNATSWPSYKRIVKNFRNEQGREVMILRLSIAGQRMFERTGWDHQIN
jgi:hypothetical protein